MVNRPGSAPALLARAALFAALGTLAACGSGPSRVSVGGLTEQLAQCRAASSSIYEASGFDDYLNRVRATARRCGIGERGLAALNGLQQRADISDEPRLPAGLVPPQWAAIPRGEYRPGAVNPTRKYVEDRIEQLSERGRQLLQQHHSLLKRVEAKYGVPAEVIVAFWGVETNFGGFMGSHDVVETLANLGSGSSRQRFFTEELLGALILLDRGLVRPGFKGSYAGAFGHAQFMPTSYIQHAVDYDGDGRADLFASLPDVFASIANYERTRGRWDPSIGAAIFEVQLPRDFPHEEADIDNRQHVGHWVSRGVTAADGNSLASHLGQTAILLPAGCRGPAFMLTQNFYAVMDYNPLVEYAMAVTMLAETIRTGEYRLVRAWPAEDALSSGERVRLQELLNRRGHGDLKVDGKLGRESRTAIRRAQASLGQCVDGYATASLLDTLDRGDTRYARRAAPETRTDVVSPRTEKAKAKAKTKAQKPKAVARKRTKGWFPAHAGTRSRRR